MRFVIHESRKLKQARPKGQYVDLLRRAPATPSWAFSIERILPCAGMPVKRGEDKKHGRKEGYKPLFIF